MKVMASRFKVLFHNYFEAGFWISALLALAFMSPTNSHASLCPLNMLDFGFCPGCGLGHSISWLFRGDVIASLKAHPLGWFAVIILFGRIITLLRIPYFRRSNFESAPRTTLSDNDLITNQPNK